MTLVCRWARPLANSPDLIARVVAALTEFYEDDEDDDDYLVRYARAEDIDPVGSVHAGILDTGANEGFEFVVINHRDGGLIAVVNVEPDGEIEIVESETVEGVVMAIAEHARQRPQN